MKALVFHGSKDVRIDTVDDPVLEKPDDIIVKVTSTAICGSDLHIYNGMFPQPRPMVLGHEFMGEIVEAGKEINRFKKGDRVIVPFPISCGTCWFCSHLMPVHCENSNPEMYGPDGHITEGKGGALFGYTDMYGGYNGGQAELVRVSYANVGPRIVPEGLTDDQVLFLTDIFPTGYTAIDWANMKGGETVVVFGCGPVGLMAQKVAWLKGASRVIALDVQEYRLQMAKMVCKAEVINARNKDAIEQIRALTNGRGADVVIDAVGMEADHSLWDSIGNIFRMQVGYLNAFRMALDAVRRGGFVSVVGVYGFPYDNFPIHQMFDKGLTIRTGQAPVHKYIDELIALVTSGKIKLDDIITHRLNLSEAPHAYEIFNEKKDNCVKVVLKP